MAVLMFPDKAYMQARLPPRRVHLLQLETMLGYKHDHKSGRHE